MIQGFDYDALIYSGTNPDNAPQGAQKLNDNFKNMNFCNAVANFASLPLTNNNVGDVRKTLDTGKEYMWNGTNWVDYENKIIIDTIGTASINTNTIEPIYDSVALSLKYNVRPNSIDNSHIKNSANIDWDKISKVGSSISDFDDSKHNSLADIQGGNSTERYHLLQSEHDTLTNGSNADSLHKHDHANLENLLGSGEYHFSQTEHDTLTNGSNADSLHKHTSDYIDTTTTNFDNILSPTEDTVQKALDKIDDKIKSGTPTLANDPGDEGDIQYDTNYLYIKTSAGWKKVLLSNL